MTRKDYVLIAGAINATIPAADQRDAALAVNTLIAEIARVLRSDNPRFDGARFYDACMGGK